MNEQEIKHYASWSAVLSCQKHPDIKHGVMQIGEVLQTGFCLGATFYSVGQSFPVHGMGKCVPTYAVNDTFAGHEPFQ